MKNKRAKQMMKDLTNGNHLTFTISGNSKSALSMTRTLSYGVVSIKAKDMKGGKNG